MPAFSDRPPWTFQCKTTRVFPFQVYLVILTASYSSKEVTHLSPGPMVCHKKVLPNRIM